MFKNINDIVITKISLAIYVESGTGQNVHNNRQFHGLVFNDETSVKDYCFSDGSVLHTTENSLFYLPKGSSYVVKNIKNGSCYAINFDANIDEKPFCVKTRNKEGFLKLFRNAEKRWKRPDTGNIYVMRTLYDILIEMQNESQKDYMPDSHFDLIAPAVKKINSDFTDNDLSVSQLAQLCNISEAYFRRIFINKFGISPKEYIISMRINYAERLLRSGQFTVSAVASLCGYFEACYFSRDFKRRIGISPSEFKKNLH